MARSSGARRMTSWWAGAALAGTVAVAVAAGAASPATAREGSRADAVGAALEAIESDPILLREFFVDLPKGADLHQHLSGTVYAESMLRWAAEDGLCINSTTFDASPPPCGTGQLTAASVAASPSLTSQTIGAWSMRMFIPSLGYSGHDHFFNTFARFGPVLDSPGREGSGLAEVLRLAALDNVVRVETKVTANSSGASGLAAALTSTSPASVTDPARFNEAFAVVEAAGLATVVEGARQQADATIARARSELACGTPSAEDACDVDFDFIAQVNRNGTPARVFAGLATSFATAAVDGRWVAADLVSPEDGINALAYYSLQMEMVRFFRAKYPQVNVTLHAGELIPGIVPPKDLTFHIHDAVMVAGADRIGHGVDIRGERDAQRLLRTMRERGITVEVSLTSNEQILGINAHTSQFRVFRKAGVPVVLATDDAGIERTTLSREYQKAHAWFDLTYADLKELSYQGIESAFVSETERKQLLRELDADFAAFEREWAQKKAA